MKSFSEFELEIERAGESYLATVRQSPLGRQGRRARCTFSLPDLEDLEDGGADSRHLSVEGQAKGSARDLGRRLFEAVFQGPVLVAWRASLALAPRALSLRLLLADDALLLSVPWELLYDVNEGEFIATERCLIRSLDAQPEVRPLKGKAPLRVLVILSCPLDVAPLEIEEEWAVLREALGNAVELKRVQPHLDEVDRALRSGTWDVLHFVGHGEVDEEGGYLILEERQGEARMVDHLRVGMFLGHPSLQLVVLNACVGGCPGAGDAFSGVAQVLVKRGVPAVVAMQRRVSDRAAIAFTRSFYRALTEKVTVAQALRRARRALFRDREAEWTVPVLYLNGPDGPLVKSRSIWRIIVAMLVGFLILGLASWYWLHKEPPLRQPRGDEQNPRECPSPPGLNMALVRIDPEPFRMGDEGAKESRPVHQVTLTRPFCIGVYEVTREQWARVFKLPLPEPKQRYLPAAGIKFAGAENFVLLLRENDPDGPFSRLPTEAEWEYVARGKTSTRYSFLGTAADLELHGNCGEKGDRFDDLTWVGQFAPNLWGVYDMYGNVSEWVSDWYGAYPFGNVTDPEGPSQGELRIRRGGSWKSDARTCTSAARKAVEPLRYSQETGFRIVREIR